MGYFTHGYRLQRVYDRLSQRDTKICFECVDEAASTMGAKFIEKEQVTIPQLILFVQKLEGHYFLIDNGDGDAILFHGIYEITICNQLLRNWSRRSGVGLKRKGKEK